MVLQAMDIAITVSFAKGLAMADGTEVARAVPGDDGRLMEEFGHQLQVLRREIQKAVMGQEAVVDELLTCLFARGHALPVQALDNDYLGVRIAACKALRVITGREIAFDPWASRAERAQAVQSLAQQFATTSAKPSVPANAPGT